MLKLKSTTQAPPNGWLYTQRETGWNNWTVVPASVWDYNLLCQEIQKHRRANPQFKMNTAMPAIMGEVMIVNSQRVAAMPNTESYLMDVGEGSSSFTTAPHSLHQLAAVAKNLSVGAKTILDFEESGEPPVSNEQATSRAKVCVSCPQNQSGDLSRFFTIPAAALIKAQFERAHEMKLETGLDNQLNVCAACLCPLKLKVHFPLSFILTHMSDEVKSKLDGRCWILGESTPTDQEAA